MLDTVESMINQIRKDSKYQLDIDTMNAYFTAYGFEKDTLAFNLLFPPVVDIRYVQ